MSDKGDHDFIWECLDGNPISPKYVSDDGSRGFGGNLSVGMGGGRGGAVACCMAIK